MIPRLSTLRARLLMTYLGLILLGFGGLTWLAGRQIAQSAYDDYASNLRVQALLLASSLGESVEHIEEYGTSIDQVSNLLQRATQNSAVNVAILDPRGRTLFGGDGTIVGRDFGNSPEVQTALSNESLYDVRRDDSGIQTIYTAAPIRYEESVTGYVHLSVPASIPQEAVRQRWFALAGSFLGFSILGTVISLWLLSTLTRPLKNLRNTALLMAQGDLAQRVENPTEDEIGEVGTAFNQMATQVETMVAEQRAFASNASHELRTPLTTIRLRTEALQSDQLDAATSLQYITEIDAEAQRMSSLVNDLILLSRLDAQKLEIGEQQTDLSRLVHSVRRELSDMAERKEIMLLVEDSEQVAPIQGNLNHVQVVVRNLLENAIKYTPDGGTVTTSVEQIDGFVRLQIVDTGQGIEQEELPRVVQRFYRADKARSRQSEGVGLGLALVRSVVDLYGGELKIESSGIGQGTTASVLWPC